jgi:hypothetical protein
MTPGSDHVTVLRAPLDGTSRYAAQRRDWASATSHTLSGVSVQPMAATEATVDREYTATHLALYALPGADLLAADRVVWRGVTYEVDGPPATWFDLGGVADHVEAVIKRMAG